jgi:hypothetical protein
MRALSFRPPWGYLCATAAKDIENRDWPLPRGFILPQRIYIHQSKTWDLGENRWDQADFIRQRTPEHRRSEILTYMANMFSSYRANHRVPDNILAEEWGIGAIIGEVDIIGQVHTTDIGHPATKSPWFWGAYGFILRNPVLYDKPIPCRGMLGFFTPDIEKGGA